MTVGSSLFLFLLPLAAAPVVFHLLVRRNRRTVKFSTDMFFQSMQPQLSFHRKFREPLLLAARVLLLLFLLLALARLAFPGMRWVLGLGGRQAVVVLIDNSASMTGQVEDGDRSKLTVALEGARALLKNMDARGKAAVALMVPDTGAARLGGLTADKEPLLAFLESVRATEATGDAASALLRAAALLKDPASGGGGSLHVFTDVQEEEWKAASLETGDWPANVSVFLHRVPSAEPEAPNVCPVRAELSSRRILPNQPYFLELLLRNDGDRELEIRVNRNDSERSVANLVTVTIGAGAQKLVKLPVQPKSPGRHWIRVWLEGDGFDGDNRIFVPYICEQKGDIYFLGDKADFGLLPVAFSPAGDGRVTSLVPSFLAQGALKSRMEAKTPMLVVLTWTAASTLDGPTSGLLDQYTRQGGNLLVLPEVNGGKPGAKMPSWLGAAPEPLISVPVSLPLRVAGETSPFWSDLRDLDGRVRIGAAFAKQYQPLAFVQDAGYVSLLEAGDDRSVLALRKHGDGQIVVSGLAFGRTGAWSTLPRLRTFLVLTQPMALGAVSGLAHGSRSMVAGDAPRLMPGDAEEMSIATLLGDAVDWTGPKNQAPVLVRAGAYIVSIGGRHTCLTVLPSPREGRGAFIQGNDIGALADMPHEVSTLSDEDDFRGDLIASLAGIGLSLPFLLLALLCLFAEGLLGSPARKLKDRDTEDAHNKPWVATAVGSGEEAS